jgi:hypothetical protein
MWNMLSSRAREVCQEGVVLIQDGGVLKQIRETQQDQAREHNVWFKQLGFW